MLNEAEILIQGEHKLGQYQVEIARRGDSGWVPTVPPLHAMVTNYRIVLQPQTRRRYVPASIPANYIVSVNEVELGNRTGTRIILKTGHHIHLYVSWAEDLALAEALKVMLTSPVGSHFHDRLALRDIKRLIHFIDSL